MTGNGVDETAAERSPFSFRIYRDVWIASLVSNIGGLIQAVGAAWMMTSMKAAPEMIALVQASTSLPIMLLALWAGAVADNLDRRLVMLWAQSLMLLLSIILTVLAWLDLLTPWTLLCFTFAIGCGTAINAPAWQASVGDIVPRQVLPSAVAFNGMGFNIARSAGPAIGGLIVAAAGTAAAFLTNALSYLGLMVVLARWRRTPPPRLLPRERLGDAMLAGLRYGAMSPSIRRVLLRGGLFALAATAVQALMPLIARDLIGGGPLTFGLLLGSFGIGAVGGVLLSRHLRTRLSTETIVFLAAVGAALGILGAAESRTLLLTVPALAVVGGGWVLALATFNVSIQMASPRWVVARTLALYQMATFGGMTLGSWAFGQVAGAHGVAAALSIGGVVMLVVAAMGLRWPMPQIGTDDLDTPDWWREPEIEVPIEPRSGPIVITVEHRIAPEQITEFLSLMRERRRLKLRDGARKWTLLRDLEDAELWIERFHFPTWLDYVRHNQRRTVADTANGEALQALRLGGEPRVHRMIEREVGMAAALGESSGSSLLHEPLTEPVRSA